MNLRVVAAITRKDIIDAIRHRYLLTAITTPLFVALLFRVLLPGGSSTRNILSVVVHDSGNSAMTAALRKTSQVSVFEVKSVDETLNEVEKRKALGGLVVPANFDADVSAGKQPELIIYVNNKKSTFEQTAFRRLVDQLVESLVKRPEPARLVWIDVEKDFDQPTRRAPALDQLLLPLLLIMTFGMTGALVVPLLLVEEKEKRTLDFLLASPAGLKEIITGKALTAIVYSVLIAGLLLGINRQLVGNWPLTLLTILVGMLLVVAIGLFMGSLLNNTMQVNTWASSVLIVLLVPSFPNLGLPAAVDTAMRLIPTYYLNEALKLALVAGVSSRIWVHLMVVFLCAVAAFSGAALFLRRRNG
jgi:ABC-2 type transport system permease protein